MLSVKEKMSNVGAKVQEKVEEGKASAQEKVNIQEGFPLSISF